MRGVLQTTIDALRSPFNVLVLGVLVAVASFLPLDRHVERESIPGAKRPVPT